MHSVSFVFDGNVFTIIFGVRYGLGPSLAMGGLPYQVFHRATGGAFGHAPHPRCLRRAFRYRFALRQLRYQIFAGRGSAGSVGEGIPQV